MSYIFTITHLLILTPELRDLTVDRKTLLHGSAGLGVELLSYAAFVSCAEVKAFCSEGSLFGTDVFDGVGESTGFRDFFLFEFWSISDKDTDRINDENQYDG